MKKKKFKIKPLEEMVRKYKDNIIRKDGCGYKISTVNQIAIAIGLDAYIFNNEYDQLTINTLNVDFGGWGGEREVAYVYEMCLHEKQLLDKAQKESNRMAHFKRLETRKGNSTRKVLFEKHKT